MAADLGQLAANTGQETRALTAPHLQILKPGTGPRLSP
jgi:hypothetical protein